MQYSNQWNYYSRVSFETEQWKPSLCALYGKGVWKGLSRFWAGKTLPDFIIAHICLTCYLVLQYSARAGNVNDIETKAKTFRYWSLRSKRNENVIVSRTFLYLFQRKRNETVWCAPEYVFLLKGNVFLSKGFVSHDLQVYQTLSQKYPKLFVTSL